MNKDKIYQATDNEFITMVENSTSINDLAAKMGYAHHPGGNTRIRIKDRIISLGIELNIAKKYEHTGKRTSDIEVIDTNHLGQIGESYFIYECAKYNIPISKPITEGCIYDFIIDTKFGLRKVQVKSSSTISKGKIVFKTARMSHKTTNLNKYETYTDNEIDLFYFFNNVLGEGYLMSVNDAPNMAITFRIDPSKNNGGGTIRYAEDHLFSKAINKPV